MKTFISRSVTKATLTLAVPALFLVSLQLHAADRETIAETLQQNAEDPIIVPAEETPEQLWQSYLDAAGYTEGPNELEGKTFFIQSATAAVRGSFDRNWISNRNVALEKAELIARNQLAEAIETEISSSRSLEMFSGGGDLPPQEREVVVTHDELSLVEKGEKLMSVELDEKLRRHIPDWDGTGATPEDARKKLAVAGSTLRNQISSHASAVIRGATTMFQTEGYNDRGDYVVLVAIVWSQKLSLVARSLTDPEIQLPNGTPKQSIKQSLESQLAQDPTFLAKFNGIRVWRDELGRRVLVSAVSNDRGSEDFITESKNALVARNLIARFSAEAVTSSAGTSGGQYSKDYDDGTLGDFDAGKFEQTIKGVVESTRITGALVVKKWKGVHPISRSPMITTVMAWSPDNTEKMNIIVSDIEAANSKNGQRSNRPTALTPRTLTGPAAEFDDF